MGVLQEIERLGLELNEEDLSHVKAISEDIERETQDKTVVPTLVDLHVTEYLSIARPDIMAILVQEKEREMLEWQSKIERQYDDQGNRVCDEPFCDSIEGVAKCRYCGKFVCKEHNYAQDIHCCYACRKERFGDV
ncbi:MAG: hypothetical protein A4E63_02405 [Syntrophorhabdus sp. PtaU1.Bin050]|nr:MAG: hypothetical protein A4E63_02405 [Syntrophorhabdus sp. PtaU1.Bin050]